MNLGPKDTENYERFFSSPTVRRIGRHGWSTFCYLYLTAMANDPRDGEFGPVPYDPGFLGIHQKPRNFKRIFGRLISKGRVTMSKVDGKDFVLVTPVIDGTTASERGHSGAIDCAEGGDR